MSKKHFYPLLICMILSPQSSNPATPAPKTKIKEYNPQNLPRLKEKLQNIIKSQEGLYQDIRFFIPDILEDKEKKCNTIGTIININPLVAALCAGLYTEADLLLRLMDLKKHDIYDRSSGRLPLLYLINFVIPSLKKNRPYLTAVALDHGASIQKSEQARQDRLNSIYQSYPNQTNYGDKDITYYTLINAFHNKSLEAKHILLFSKSETT